MDGSLWIRIFKLRTSRSSPLVASANSAISICVWLAAAVSVWTATMVVRWVLGLLGVFSISTILSVIMMQWLPDLMAQNWPKKRFPSFTYHRVRAVSYPAV